MGRYRGRHRAPARFELRVTGQALARTAVAGAVLGTPLVVAPAAHAADSTWDRLAHCESSGNWSINTGNGYSGGLQFSPRTWKAFGGIGLAHHASREQQIAVAERVLAKQGWGAWPACSRKLGLRGKPAPSSVKAAPQATPSGGAKAAPQATPSGGAKAAKAANGRPHGRRRARGHAGPHRHRERRHRRLAGRPRRQPRCAQPAQDLGRRADRPALTGPTCSPR